MCLAIPTKVEKILAENRAIVSLNNVQKEVSTDLITDLEVGDYVIVHVGYALEKIAKDEVKLIMEHLNEY